MDVEVIPGTDQERQIAFLAFSSVLGVGVIAYEAARSIKEGDLFKTDEVKEKPKAGLLALGMGMAMLGVSVHETMKETGWKPLALGAVGVTAFAYITRAVRRRR